MKVKQIFMLLAVVAISLLGIKVMPAQAAQQKQEVLQGMVRLEVVEATESEPSHYRFFIERCSGKPCDWEALRQAESEGKSLADLQIKNVYLTGKIDFEGLVHKEVLLLGQSAGAKTLRRSKAARTGSSDEFEVSEVIKVLGDRQAELMAAAGPEFSAPPLIIPPPTRGQENLLVLMVNLQSNPITPYTPQQIKDLVFTGPRSVKKYFEDVSWYQPGSNRGFSIKGVNDPAGDVTPWLSVTAGPSSGQTCVNYLTGNLRTEADNLAEANGFSKVMYPNRAYLYAPNICSTSPFASVAPFGDNTAMSYFFMGLSIDGTQSWLDLAFHTFIHEYDHTLGRAAHSNGRQTETSPVLEYADRADPLGNSTILTFNSNINRATYGFLTTGRFAPPIEYRMPEPYRVLLQTPAIPTKGVGPSDPPMGAYILLRDLAGNLTGEVFVLEYRKSMGMWDQFGTDTQAYNGGLAIRKTGLDWSHWGTGTVIQDTTPATSCCKDAPLKPTSWAGATWTSNLYGVSIKAFPPTVYGMWVEIILGNNYPTQ
jgi:hypothetical protein